jgi:hypothetical protein
MSIARATGEQLLANSKQLSDQRHQPYRAFGCSADFLRGGYGDYAGSGNQREVGHVLQFVNAASGEIGVFIGRNYLCSRSSDSYDISRLNQEMQRVMAEQRHRHLIGGDQQDDGALGNGSVCAFVRSYVIHGDQRFRIGKVLALSFDYGKRGNQASRRQRIECPSSAHSGGRYQNSVAGGQASSGWLVRLTQVDYCPELRAGRNVSMLRGKQQHSYRKRRYHYERLNL